MSAAVLPLPHADSTPAPQAVNFCQARFAFGQLENFLTSQQANLASEAHVEQQIESRGREILRLLLQAHLRQRGTGDVGPALRVFPPPSPAAPDSPGADRPGAGVRHGHRRLHELTLRTALGEVTLERTGYAAAAARSVHPLDGQLQLPRRCFSYPLQERLVRSAVQGPFDEAVADLERDTAVKLSKRSAEQVVAEAAVDFQDFYRQQPGDAKQTGEVVVTGIDCKGVPMVRPQQTLRKTRLKRGDKKHKKRLATVASVRTQPRRVRTPEEVTDSLFRTAAKPKQPRVRKRPPGPVEHKRVWADLLASKDEVIAEVAAEVKRADPAGVKTHVALCDGERALQKRIVPALLGVVPAVVLVLDLLHVLEKVWQVAHCFYPEGSEAEATAWMREQTLRLLRGGVSGVIKGMRRRATLRGLAGQKRGTLDEVAAYLSRNRQHVRYDEYLAQGLPIASGCVEGACKNLIKDRMERSGMRWSLEGGEAMIRLRSLYLSGDLDDYWDFHLEQERLRLYPPGRWEVEE
jgi:hypothetical protein